MRTRFSFKVAVAVGALAAVAAAVHLVRARPLASQPSPSRGGWLGTPGSQATWAVTLETRLQQAAGARNALDGTTTLTGKWVATLSGACETGYDVAYELREAHAIGVGFGEVDPLAVARLEQSLGERFWVSYQNDGAAKLLHFPRDMRDDVRNFLTLLITETQLVRQAQPSLQWTATERDGAGTYFAAYTEARPGEITKRKLRYLSVDGANQAAINVEIKDSQARFELDAGGLVQRTSASDHVVVESGWGAPGLTIDIGVELRDAHTSMDRQLVGSLERARSHLETGPVAAQRVADDVLQARQDARRMGNVTLAQLLDRAAKGNVDADTRAGIEAFLRQRPSEIPGALTFARRADGRVAKIVLDAMGAAATTTAQDALSGLTGDGAAPVALRVDAIAALIQTKKPSSSTVSQLIALLDAAEPAVSKQALYVLGALGARCQDTDATATARIENELLRRQRSCRGQQCTDLLVGLGNLATAAVVPAIEAALRDRDAVIRAAAARALRKVKEPSADRLIATTMTEDSDPAVRSAAVLAATFRPIGPLLEPLTHVVQADPVEYVRTNAIEAVAGHVDESPLVQNVLLAAAAGDRSPGVRRLARKILGPRAMAQ